MDPHLFGEEIAAQGAGFGLPPLVAAWIALALEAGLGLALLLDLRRRPVLVAATLLVAFFLFLTGRFAWRAAHGQLDPGASCGCFGALVERTPAEAFLQDLLLMAPALALAWVGRPGARRFAGARWMVTALGTAGLVGFAVAAPGLPIDDRATRLRPGVALAELCAGAGDARICLTDLASELATGEHWVVVADPDDPGFAAIVGALNARVRSGAEPPAALLADLTPDELQAIYWEHAPAFDVHETPQALLRPLYRRLPRSFAVADGWVTATWDGLPPALDAREQAVEPR
jgi:uncharacterized membrane protein YphA (DoxX/SURF4 family)